MATGSTVKTPVTDHIPPHTPVKASTLGESQAILDVYMHSFVYVTVLIVMKSAIPGVLHAMLLPLQDKSVTLLTLTSTGTLSLSAEVVTLQISP